MTYQTMNTTLRSEKGNALLITIVIIMILTSLGIFALQSTTYEIDTSAAEKREKTNFFNAETGLKFAVSYFKLIYSNETDTTTLPPPIYALDATGVGVGALVSINAGNLASTTVFNSGSNITSLQNMAIGTGGVVFTYTAPDPDNAAVNIPIARIEIRAIMLNPPAIATLSTEANNVPSRFHLGPAPEGYSNTLFAARNYCITSTALNLDGSTTNSILQCGIVIAALRNSVSQFQGL